MSNFSICHNVFNSFQLSRFSISCLDIFKVVYCIISNFSICHNVFNSFQLLSFSLLCLDIFKVVYCIQSAISPLPQCFQLVSKLNIHLLRFSISCLDIFKVVYCIISNFSFATCFQLFSIVKHSFVESFYIMVRYFF